MMTAPTPVAPAELTAVECTSRCPLLLLIGSGLIWLLLSGALGLLAALQLHAPAVLASCSYLTYGHTQAMAETAFVYGWIGNLGLAMGLWVLRQLSAEPLRAVGWTMVGTVFWNLAILGGLVGIATGEATAIPFLQMPGAVQPLMLVAYGAIGVTGVLAWADRRREMMFAAQWYAVAALFLFPWLFSAAQVMLVWAPVRGTLQAVVGGWFAQGLWTLWMAPLALAGAYYVVPRASGKLLPGYDSAALGFWSLLFLGGWTGGRHLIGGPVPAWISTIAIVTSVMLIFHYIVVFLNLRVAYGTGGTALKFIGFGLAAYVAGGFLDALTSMRAVAEVTQFTYVGAAQHQLAMYGGVSAMLFGTLYFALPRITGYAWASSGLIRGHWALTVVGILLLVAALAGAGWVQGTDLINAAVSFSDIAAHTRPWLEAATAAQALLLLGNLLLTVNFLQSAAAGCKAGRNAR
jgi:cytochrome c oxidase cbb3-type subunit 1